MKKTLTTVEGMAEAKVIEFNNDLACVYEQKGDIRDSGASRLMMHEDAFHKGFGLSQEVIDRLFKLLDKKLYDKFIKVFEAEVSKVEERNTNMKKKAKKGKTEETANEEATQKKGKKVKAEKKEPKAKKAAEKGRYGHRVGSSANFMDDLIWAGVKPDAAAEQISKEFSIPADKAKAKFLVHVRYLKKEKGVEFAKFKGDTDKVKAKTERI